MQKKYRDFQFEFVALMASLMSVVALAIDALLPALDIISDYWDYQSWITTHYDFSWPWVWPSSFWPLSDSFGRKPVVYMGFVYCASFICVNATSLEVMVIGRILQGIGLSAPER
jgi:DHA1 family bicyclomycin/chloramphenicol resistance-like MFS transporter